MRSEADLKEDKQFKLLVEQTGREGRVGLGRGAGAFGTPGQLSCSGACYYQPISGVSLGDGLPGFENTMLVNSYYISFVLIFTYDLLSTNHVSGVAYIVSLTPYHNPEDQYLYLSIFQTKKPKLIGCYQ